MKYVLFVCTHNAGRSQIAQALFERYGPDDVGAESAGSDPASQVWPAVVEAMSEIRIDLSGPKPKRLSVEMQLHADWAVTMGCGDACPYVPTTVDDWDIPDPAGRPLQEVREIRDMIDERVQDLADSRIDAIRLDATAHRFRLAKLLPALIEEFGDRREPEVIRGCADRILDDYDEVPIRSHILTLAHKRTRECLRHEHCDVILSGAHINPSVTIAFTLTGATMPTVAAGSAFLYDAVLTAFLMFVIMAVATDTRAVGAAAAIAIGGVIGLDALFGGPVTGASMNPARSFGPALVSGEWKDFWVYLAGPIVGAGVGAFAYQLIRGEHPPHPARHQPQEQPDGARSVRLPA